MGLSRALDNYYRPYRIFLDSGPVLLPSGYVHPRDGISSVHRSISDIFPVSSSHDDSILFLRGVAPSHAARRYNFDILIIFSIFSSLKPSRSLIVIKIRLYADRLKVTSRSPDPRSLRVPVERVVICFLIYLNLLWPNL